jgi:hypothetical protein
MYRVWTMDLLVCTVWRLSAAARIGAAGLGDGVRR